MCKCIGCGAKLQSVNASDIGYTSHIEKKLCERCFRIRNYNEYRFVIGDNNDYIKTLKEIGKTQDLIILVVDLFNISSSLNEIGKYLNNNILLVLTKRDILPRSCYDLKLKEYFDRYNLNILDTIIISSVKNYNFDLLYEKINQYKTSDRVYVVGYTNSGKSTMINKLLYNYSSNSSYITTSNLPSTTINSIELKLNQNLTLIDTPGLLENGDIINFLSPDMIKKVIPSKEIRPITYQIKNKQSIIVDGLFRIDISNSNSLTFYISNNLNIFRKYREVTDLINLKKHKIKVNDNSDIVIQGLGFIKIVKKCEVDVYLQDGVSVYVRDSLI